MEKICLKKSLLVECLLAPALAEMLRYDANFAKAFDISVIQISKQRVKKLFSKLGVIQQALRKQIMQ